MSVEVKERFDKKNGITMKCFKQIALLLDITQHSTEEAEGDGEHKNLNKAKSSNVVIPIIGMQIDESQQRRMFL